MASVNSGRIDRPFESKPPADGGPAANAEPPATTPEPSGDTAAPEPAGDQAAVRIAELEQQAKETYERLLRVSADFENYRKRIEREKQEYVKFANERLLRDLLPIVDNLRRALRHAKESGDSPVVVAGVDLVLQEFLKVLERYGVTAIQSAGQMFDPALHEALQMVEVEDKEPGSVIEELQSGYLLHGRVLRPALVTVSTAPEQTSPGVRLPEPEDE